ncbi:hypothetical protein Y032_0002g889 [Ancylostoma ceylanicum]|uniref:Uncharacterized protein n=1 Tax=Ancylostoma ceylanicum TaxID=53326 RepID=A0A016W209_9BILA|nr:hypothetical protein Y032_0002g889 [Ancylostoma ceylanicum]
MAVFHSAVGGREKRADARHSSYCGPNPNDRASARMMLHSARYLPDYPFGPHHARFRPQFARNAPLFKPFVGDWPADGTGFAPVWSAIAGCSYSGQKKT